MPAVNPAQTEADSDRSKAGRVYATLRRRIRELTLPPGARLNKNDIAAEFGVSRAPVSEAIARLAEDSLVDVFPQNGSFVAPIRPDVIFESMLIRTGLEVEAIRRVTALGDDKLIAALDANVAEQQAALKKGDMVWLDDLDEAFHAIIFAPLKSERLVHLLDNCRALLDRPRFHALPEDGRPEATVTEHRRITDAIRSRDVEFAGSAMRVHLAMVARAIERGLAHMETSNAE